MGRYSDAAYAVEEIDYNEETEQIIPKIICRKKRLLDKLRALHDKASEAEAGVNRELSAILDRSL